MAEVAFNPGLSGMPVKVKPTQDQGLSTGADQRFSQALDLVSRRATKAKSSGPEEVSDDPQPVNDDGEAAAELNPWALVLMMGLVPAGENVAAANQGADGMELPVEAGADLVEAGALFSDVGLNLSQGQNDSQVATSQNALPEEVKTETVPVAENPVSETTPWRLLAGSEVAQAWPGLDPQVATEVAQILSDAARVLQESAATPGQESNPVVVPASEKSSGDGQPFLAVMAGNSVKPLHLTGNVSGAGLVMQPTLRQEAEALLSEETKKAGETFALTPETESADGPLNLAVLQTSKQGLKTSVSDSEQPLFQINPLQQGESGTSGNEGAELTGKTVSTLKPSEVFTQIVERARVMVEDGVGEMHLNLKPDSLGKIQLKVSLENQLISAKFVAESDQVKALIETNLVDLKRMLNQNGVQVDQVTVAVDHQQAAGGGDFDGRSFAGNAHPEFGGKGGGSEKDVAESDLNGVEPSQVGQLTQIDLKA